VSQPYFKRRHQFVSPTRELFLALHFDFFVLFCIVFSGNAHLPRLPFCWSVVLKKNHPFPAFFCQLELPVFSDAGCLFMLDLTLFHNLVPRVLAARQMHILGGHFCHRPEKPPPPFPWFAHCLGVFFVLAAPQDSVARRNSPYEALALLPECGIAQFSLCVSRQKNLLASLSLPKSRDYPRVPPTP